MNEKSNVIMVMPIIMVMLKMEKVSESYLWMWVSIDMEYDSLLNIEPKQGKDKVRKVFYSKNLKFVSEKKRFLVVFSFQIDGSRII